MIIIDIHFQGNKEPLRLNCDDKKLKTFDKLVNSILETENHIFFWNQGERIAIDPKKIIYIKEVKLENE